MEKAIDKFFREMKIDPTKPVGIAMTIELMEKFSTWLREPDGWLCEDERFFKYPAEALIATRAEGLKKTPIPIYFSPVEAKEVSDEEIEKAADLNCPYKKHIIGQEWTEGMNAGFIKGAEWMRSLLTGQK